MNQLLTNIGDTHSVPAAKVSVNIEYKGFGAGYHLYRVTVTSPGFCPQPVGDDDRSFGHPDQTTAQQQAESYRDALVGYHTDSAAVRTDDELIAGITANLDQAARNTTHQKARNIGAYAITGQTNRKHRKDPLTPTMKRALAHAEPSGEIRVQAGIAATTLRALELSGLGRTIGSTPTRHDVVKLALNERGLRMAEQVKAEVTA